MPKRIGYSLIAWLVIAWTFAVTVARGIRLPNDYSESQWLLDYRFGFMKRGLIGSICSAVAGAFGREMSARAILALSVITFGAFCSVLFALLIRLSRKTAPRDFHALAIVFVSSSFVVMSGHLLGYFDALIYTCAVASVALTLRGRPLMAGIVSAVAVLSYEAYLLIGLPLVALASVAVLATGERPVRWRRHTLGLGLPVAAFLAIAVLQPLLTDPLVLRERLYHHLEMFGFVMSKSRDTAVWQTTTFPEFMSRQIGELSLRLFHPVAVACVGPPLLALLAYTHASFRIRPFGRLSLVLLAAVCAPLAMHAVAWDTARIATYTIGGAFVAWWILAETRPAAAPGSLFLLAALPAGILNVFQRIPLMDDAFERFTDPMRLLLYAPALALLAFAALRPGPAK